MVLAVPVARLQWLAQGQALAALAVLVALVLAAPAQAEEQAGVEQRVGVERNSQHLVDIRGRSVGPVALAQLPTASRLPADERIRHRRDAAQFLQVAARAAVPSPLRIHSPVKGAARPQAADRLLAE